MLVQLREDLQAFLQSRRFTPYLEGTAVELPDGRSLTLKVAEVQRSVRNSGFKHARYSFITKMTGGQFIGHGFGEAESKLLAFQKSLSEATERVVLQAAAGTSYGTTTSSGWAAHTSEKAARKSAFFELLERDAVLTHWLCKRPMLEIVPESLPHAIRDWAQTELAQSPRFQRLRVLVADQGYFPAVTVLLQSTDSFGAISHASDGSLDKAVYRALSEASRIAQLVEHPELIQSSASLVEMNPPMKAILPDDHAAVYAHHLPVPEWLFGPQAEWATAARAWNDRARGLSADQLGLKFHVVAKAPLVVGYATSHLVQHLYFGRTKEAASQGWLNLERLRSVMPTGDFNPLPHFVP